MRRRGSRSTGMPTKPEPTSADRPMPKMVSARPVATWFEVSESVRTPKTSAISAPATAPVRMPSTALPVVTVIANAVTAPASIMPSTPRLSTPERSATSSPRAANKSGVAALITVTSTRVVASRLMRGRPPGARRRSGRGTW